MRAIIRFLFYFIPMLTLAANDNLNTHLETANFIASPQSSCSEIGLQSGATWTYQFITQGVEYRQSGQHAWNYRSIFTERIVNVYRRGDITVYVAERKLKSHHGEQPSADVMPRMGTLFYILKNNEIGYTHWDGYSSLGANSYRGQGVYIEYEHLNLMRLANAPILYVLPLRAPAAWHQTISERTENATEHFLSGPHCETKLAHLDVLAGPMKNCYKIDEPSTTTKDECWICRGVGLVSHVEERSGGDGHGSLVYRSETTLLRYENGYF